MNLPSIRLVGQNLLQQRDARFTLAICCSLLLHVLLAISIGYASHRKQTHNQTISRLSAQLVPSIAPTPVQDFTATANAVEVKEASQASASPEAPGKLIGLADSSLYYFGLRELDVAPKVVVDVPVTPYELRNLPHGGSVKLELWIDERGRVVDAQLIETNLPFEFAESARKSFLKTLFNPGQKDGTVVRSRLRISVDYAPLILENEGLFTFPRRD